MSDLQAQIDELRGQIEDLTSTFDASAIGAEGREGAAGERGEQGEQGDTSPPAEIDNEGKVVESFTDEVNNEGKVESPLNETKLEKKGGITKKNLKTEAEKEGFKAGEAGGLKPGPYENAAAFEVKRAEAGESREKRVLSASKDLLVTVSWLLKGNLTTNFKAEANAFVQQGGKTFGTAGATVHTNQATESTTEESGSFTIFVPKGAELELEVGISLKEPAGHIYEAKIQTVCQIALD